MKIFKGLLIGIIGLFVLLTLISLIIPSKILTVRAVAVQADSIKIFDEISDLKNWKNWHPVFINDSANIKYNNKTNQVGGTATWVTNNKENCLQISKIAYPNIYFALKRDGENDLENVLSITPVQEKGNMQVQWQSITSLKWYPWEKFSGIFIEKMAGSGIEIALESFKNYIEKTK